MHRSRIGVVLIDHPNSVFDEATRFWAAALGNEPRRSDDPADPYAVVGQLAPGLELNTQRVGAASRIHLDVETDDVEAEVARLEALGARRLARHDGYWQMQDPGGLVFCVVPVQSDEFAELATEWP